MLPTWEDDELQADIEKDDAPAESDDTIPASEATYGVFWPD